MQIVSTRCRIFEYTVTAQGPCAVDTGWEVGVHRHFHDCLRVRVGVDHGDLALAHAAVRTIRRLIGETGAREVVIDGVAHVPVAGDRLPVTAKVDVLAALADTLDVLVAIAERLERRGELVHLMPFGWHKACRIEEVPGPGARRVIRLPAEGGPAERGSPGAHPLAGWRRRGRCVTGS